MKHMKLLLPVGRKFFKQIIDSSAGN